MERDLIYCVDEGLGIVPAEAAGRLNLTTVGEDGRDQGDTLVYCEGAGDQTLPCGHQGKRNLDYYLVCKVSGPIIPPARCIATARLFGIVIPWRLTPLTALHVTSPLVVTVLPAPVGQFLWGAESYPLVICTSSLLSLVQNRRSHITPEPREGLRRRKDLSSHLRGLPDGCCFTVTDACHRPGMERLSRATTLQEGALNVTI